MRRYVLLEDTILEEIQRVTTIHPFFDAVAKTGENSMKKKQLAKSNDEFDQRFDAGEDICDLIDLSKAAIARPGRKVRITLDISASLVEEIDRIR